MSEWTVDEATEEDRRQLVRREKELFGGGGSLNPEWLLDQNPAGKALVLVARTQEGRIAGTRALLPWRLVSNGREIPAGQSARLWTEPEFRRQGVAIAIGRELERRSLELGYLVSFLFPNDRLIPNYRRRENRLEFSLQRCQFVLSLRFFTPSLPAMLDQPLAWVRRRRFRKTPGWSVAEDAAKLAGALWERTTNWDGVVGVRDAAFVQWRFSNVSGREYVLWRYPAQGAVRLLAAIYPAPGNRARILDVWGNADRGEKTAAVAGLVEALADRGAILVEWCTPEFGNDAEIAPRVGFIRRRRGVPMGVWMNRPKEEIGDLADPQCYRLTEGDSDYA